MNVVIENLGNGKKKDTGYVQKGRNEKGGLLKVLVFVSWKGFKKCTQTIGSNRVIYEIYHNYNLIILELI